MAGNTVTFLLCHPIWQVTSCGCEMVYH